MKYIVMNDPHLDVRAPSFRRMDDYLATCLNKLEQITDLCEQLDVDVLCCTGDWFHKKNPQAVPHRLVRALLDWSHTVTDGVGIPIYTVLGNHDVQFNDLSPESVHRQPVGTLLTNRDVFWLDYHAPMELRGVHFVGSSYQPPKLLPDGTPFEDLAQFSVPYDLKGPVVQLTHASVVPERPVWSPYTLVEDLAWASGATICHTGHIHEDLGIHRIPRSDGSVFYWTNVGSMTRGSLNEATLVREPKVLMVEVEPGEEPVFTPVTLEHRPAEEIYDVTAYREEKAHDQAFTAWTSRLREELDAATSEEKSLTDIVQESSLDSRGRDLALRLLNEAGA